MSLPPIVSFSAPHPSRADIHLANSLADQLRANHSDLALEPIFQPLVTEHIDDRPTFHCDDLTEIMLPPNADRNAFLQERARLRAVEGDILATSFQPDEGYQQYCSEQLDLGQVEWLTPHCRSTPYHLAEACWEDRRIRHKLVNAIRSRGLRYIHPHYGTKAIWELALLLSNASHLPVSVIGAPPKLSALVNNKGQFATIVEAAYGKDALPATEIAWNVTFAAEYLHELCQSGASLSVKLPSSAGGQGNMVFHTRTLQGMSLTAIRDLLHESLPTLGYSSGDELIVSVWEERILAVPSVQIWIPPLADGAPILEGLFEQLIVGEKGAFDGFARSELPEPFFEIACVRTLVLAIAFQQLGYVGRCSFDLLVVGHSFADAKIFFIECNGRWGGTSLPMTLMNRLFGQWTQQPFSVGQSIAIGGRQASFSECIFQLGNLAFDARSRTGDYILLNPKRAKRTGKFTVIALGDSWTSVEQKTKAHFPDLTARLVGPDNSVLPTTPRSAAQLDS